MKRMVHWLVPGFAAIVSGCATTFETRPWNATDGNGVQNGIAYYETQPALVVWQFTQWADATGANKGSAQTDCTPVVQKSEIQSLPDLSHKMVFVQHPSNFSSSKFSVAFKDFGALASIGAETTPVADKVLAVAESAAKDVLKFNAEPKPAVPACNAGPVIKCIIPIKDFSSIPRCG